MDGGVPETIDAFLDSFASGEPAPGGGAAAALAGAMAAALVTMACRITERRAPSETMVAASEGAESLRRQLMTLMREDIEACKAVLESRRAPSERRAALMQDALVRATTVPLDMTRAAAGVLELCASILDAVPASTVGDLGVAVVLGAAALNASTLIVRINLQEIDESDFTRATRTSLAHLALGADARGRLAQRLAARAGLPVPPNTRRNTGRTG